VKQIVVVVVGRVVGGTYLVVVVPVEPRTVVPVERAAPVVVVAGATVVVVEDDVDVVVGVTVATGLALPAMKPTSTPEATPEPSKTELEIRRTRAKRRSRCWGVRGWGVMSGFSPSSLVRLPKSG